MPPKRKTSDATKAIAYLRVSRSDQQLGPQAQQQQIERWAKAQGVDVLEAITDQGVSGGAPLDKRPGLMQAIAKLRELGAGVLIVAKRDRLARDVVIAAMVERLAERNGAVICSADGTGNGGNPEHALMRGMMDLLAQYERALIRARTKAAAAAKKALGERWGSVPYGFRLADDGKTLNLDLVEQAALARIRTLREAGYSLRSIRNTLNSEEQPCRGARWHLTTVARICDRLEQNTTLATAG